MALRRRESESGICRRRRRLDVGSAIRRAASRESQPLLLLLRLRFVKFPATSDVHGESRGPPEFVNDIYS